MTKDELIRTIRAAQKAGKTELRATLRARVDGVRHVALEIDGHFNGNPNDIWIRSRSGLRTIGRMHLGSARRSVDLEGWESRIERFEPA
jgi:hypothetical protein